MDSDEREICTYLKGWRGQFVGLAEILRRAAGKRRYGEDPNWAVPVLNRLVEKAVIESDATGHYRLNPPSKQEKKKRWLAPHIRKALEASGQFEQVFEADKEEQF
jgi:hypothetical protein